MNENSSRPTSPRSLPHLHPDYSETSLLWIANSILVYNNLFCPGWYVVLHYIMCLVFIFLSLLVFSNTVFFEGRMWPRATSRTAFCPHSSSLPYGHTGLLAGSQTLLACPGPDTLNLLLSFGTLLPKIFEWLLPWSFSLCSKVIFSDRLCLLSDNWSYFLFFPELLKEHSDSGLLSAPLPKQGPMRIQEFVCLIPTTHLA